jgi:hypothetical protein
VKCFQEFVKSGNTCLWKGHHDLVQGQGLKTGEREKTHGEFQGRHGQEQGNKQRT